MSRMLGFDVFNSGTVTEDPESIPLLDFNDDNDDNEMSPLDGNTQETEFTTEDNYFPGRW